jgi:hypothetical protein
MAMFCTKCGVALSADKNFCTACGAAVAGPVIPPAPVEATIYPQAAAYQSPSPGPGAYPPAAPIPAKPGGGAVQIVLILVAVVVGVGLLMMMVFAFGAWRISRAVHMNRAGNGITLSTPGGTVTAGGVSTISDADLGVPAYPGAVRGDGGMQIHTANGSMVTASYTTADPSSQVLAFYKSKLPENVSLIETGEGAIITSGNREKDGVMITVTTNSFSTGGKTKIVIVHSKNGQP